MKCSECHSDWGAMTLELVGLKQKLAEPEAACAAMREALASTAGALRGVAWIDYPDDCMSGESCAELVATADAALSSDAGRRALAVVEAARAWATTKRRDVALREEDLCAALAKLDGTA